MKRLLFCLMIPGLQAADPAWWTTGNTAIIDSAASHAVSENYAPASQGQLKNVAAKAALYLNNLPGIGAGAAVNGMVSGFTHTESDYSPVLLGQLKAVAKPFYDRLLEVGYDTRANLVARGYPSNWASDYPWNPSTPASENYGPANLGQMKITFSFDLTGFPAGDNNHNGLPDAWEQQYYPNGIPSTPGWADQDSFGMTFRMKALHGLDPTKDSTNDIGISDGWLVQHGIDPKTADPDSDDDEHVGDGLSLKDEYLAGTDPNKKDTDDDGVVDGQDGWALEPHYAPHRVNRPTYVVIPLAENQEGESFFLNEKGDVLYKVGDDYKVWSQGQSSTVNIPDDAEEVIPIGISQDGTAVISYRIPSPLLEKGKRLEILWQPAAGGSATTRSPQLFTDTEIHAEISGFFGGTPDPSNPAYFNRDDSFRFEIEDGDHSGHAGVNSDGSALVSIFHRIAVDPSQEVWVQRFAVEKVPTSGEAVPLQAATEYIGSGSFPDERFEPSTSTNSHGVTAGATLKFSGGSHYVATVWKGSPIYPAGENTHSYVHNMNANNHLIGEVYRNNEWKTAMWVDTQAGLRLDQPVNNQPTYAELLWTGQNGDIPYDSIRLNKLFEQISEHSLWINAKTYTIDSLLAKSSAEKWSSVTAFALSDSGIIAGSAISATSDKREPIALLPINVSIKKKTDTEAPKDGMVAKVGDVIEFKLSDIPPENFPVPAANIKWFYKQLKADGTYTDWADIGSDARGVKFEHTYTAGGIFEIKCEMTVGTQTITTNFERKMDNRMAKHDPDDSSEPVPEGMKKGDLDAIGICDTQKQIDVRYQAKINVNSAAYANSVDISPVGTGNHCNIFVAHKAGDAGATVPWFNGGIIPPYYPPVADQWAGVPAHQAGHPELEQPEYESKMTGWPLLPSDSYPQPGMIAGEGWYTWATGHCGIVDYDGQWISAGPAKVNRFANFIEYRTHSLTGRLPAGKRKYTGN